MAAASTLAREARGVVRDLIGTRAGRKTAKAYHSQLVKELETRAKAFDGLAALADDVRQALEGDSNDAEHDALVAVAEALGIDYDSNKSW